MAIIDRSIPEVEWSTLVDRTIYPRERMIDEGSNYF